MVSARHVMSQGPMLRSLARTALGALVQRTTPRSRPPSGPRPWIHAELAPLSPALVRDFVRTMGGDSRGLRGHLPPHLFPQWALPLAARALEGLPYPMLRVMNAGCTLQLGTPLQASEPLLVRARLESIDENDSRALLTTRIVTGTRSNPDALEATLQAFVPLGRRAGAKKEPARVPDDARELAHLSLGAGAGLDFAKLTGDFNPIHWIPAYARAAGFRGAIFHGFGTFARALQAVSHTLPERDPWALRRFEARFTKPLLLPAQVRVLATSDARLFVGDGPGGEAYLVGAYEAR